MTVYRETRTPQQKVASEDEWKVRGMLQGGDSGGNSGDTVEYPGWGKMHFEERTGNMRIGFGAKT
jgi:hypothetical protein